MEMGDEVENKSALDHLTDVFDAQLKDDNDAVAKDAFHQYVTMTAKTILNPEVDGEIEVNDDEVEAEVDDEIEVDELDLDSINIDDHITADEE